MQRVFDFKIKEKGIRKWWSASATIDVPENWDTMSEDEQREYLIKPTGSHAHPQGIYPYASRFQHAVGVESVIDFRFTSTPPNKACARLETGAANLKLASVPPHAGNAVR